MSKKGSSTCIWAIGLLLAAVLFAGCSSDDPSSALLGDNSECAIPEGDLISGGVPPDGIPALTDPPLVSAAEATYLTDDSRVIGMLVDDMPVAIPHNILWWHEITNFNYNNAPVAVTYCPLTGSSMAFDRRQVGGAEFGVSGLLFRNNLTMYNRTDDTSLWPQMNREAGCGPATGQELEMVESFEMRWGAWKRLHPETMVISEQTGFNRTYEPSGYPYGNYEIENNTRLLFGQDIDTTLPPKQRVLGIPSGNGGMAFPFGELRKSQRPYEVVHAMVGGSMTVVFWELEARGATAFKRRLNGDNLSFSIDAGRIVDDQTGSTWRLDGLAESGPLAGQRLDPVADAYVAFWFAWKDFQPETTIWRSP